jgi:hypothetical protein
MGSTLSVEYKDVIPYLQSVIDIISIIIIILLLLSTSEITKTAAEQISLENNNSPISCTYKQY